MVIGQVHSPLNEDVLVPRTSIVLYALEIFPKGQYKKTMFTSEDTLVCGDMDVEEPQKVWLGSPLEYGSWTWRSSGGCSNSHPIHDLILVSSLKEPRHVLLCVSLNQFVKPKGTANFGPTEILPQSHVTITNTLTGMPCLIQIVYK